ncbi:hypothetical protein IAR55_000235 [Kwoniella newhampshirensis]|uniref:Urea transporter n=1 Tax=Kwoniella newhampshirensis TaxID=1651941 RepID=A0AAW0Z615_9TREE
MKSLFRPFPVPLTNRQWFYLIFTQGFVAGLIDGGANFGIAYGMYHNAQYVTIWVLSKNTISGALGVTALVQCLISMLITSSLVHTDIHHKVIPPLPYVWPHVEHLPDPAGSKLFALLGVKPNNYSGQISPSDSREKIDPERSSGIPSPTDSNSPSPLPSSEQNERSHSIAMWLLHQIRLILRFTFEGTEANIFLHHPFSFRTLLHRMFLTSLQGLLIGAVFGLPLWIIFMIVIGPIYGHDNLNEKHWRWAPMVINGAFGAILGWITNPIFAALAMGSQAEHCLVIVPAEDEENVLESAGAAAEATGDDAGVHTIVEEEDENGEEVLSPPLPHHSPSASIRSPRPIPLPASPLATPHRPRGRSRASSTFSNRTKPPLTANYSDLPLAPPSPSYFGGGLLSTPRSAPSEQQPQNHLAVSPPGVGVGRERGGSIPGPPAPVFGSVPRLRNRGMTISTFVSTTQSNPASNGPEASWSYALGGTGGRAQRRLRAMTTTTTTSGPKVEGQGRALWSNNDGGKTVLGAPIGGPPTGAGASTTRPAVWDVFGRVEGASSQVEKANNEKDQVTIDTKEGK